MITLVFFALLLQGTLPPPQPAPPAPASASKQTWTGCLQAGNAPGTYRLNLDQPARTPAQTQGTSTEGTQGDPFVQLVTSATKLDLTKHVGKRLQVTGSQLTDAEAEHEAARQPNRQEANETAAGTGGTTQRHERYVRVASVTPASGECR